MVSLHLHLQPHSRMQAVVAELLLRVRLGLSASEHLTGDTAPDGGPAAFRCRKGFKALKHSVADGLLQLLSNAARTLCLESSGWQQPFSHAVTREFVPVQLRPPSGRWLMR